MSIASGFTKMKNYILTSSGYKLLSRWTSSQTVHMGDGTDDTDTVEYRFGAMKGVTSSLATDNDEFALSASAGKNLQDQCTQLNQSLTNVNNSKKTYLRLILPNIAADAKAVCDYINKNYLLGQLSPATTVDFDVVASNVDWFSGTLSTDTTTLSPGRTVWGIVQQRTSSAENSTLYKYFGSGTGGAGTVSPFKRYEDGYNTGYAAGQSAGVPSGSCIAGWRSIDSYSNGQWVTGWVGVNPNFFTVNSAGIVPTKNFTATVYWQGYNKRDIDFFSNGEMGHRDNGTSLDGVQMNFYAGTQCGFKTNDSGGGSLGAGFIVLN
jgi:hypothetical protein|nr:MAG TPA: hypothetical protein [Caudoviricetes sp.]